MAQPLAVEGAMKSLQRPLGRARSLFKVPTTSVWRLMRTQSPTLPWWPCKPGISQWESTSMRSASGTGR
jgi:hypothetical protein